MRTIPVIKYLAVSELINSSARINSCCNSTGSCFEMPNISNTQPLGFIKTKKYAVLQKKLKEKDVYLIDKYHEISIGRKSNKY